MDPLLKKLFRHAVVQDGGHHDADHVHKAQKFRGVGKETGIQLLRDQGRPGRVCVNHSR